MGTHPYNQTKTKPVRECNAPIELHLGVTLSYLTNTVVGFASVRLRKNVRQVAGKRTSQAEQKHTDKGDNYDVEYWCTSQPS